MSSPSPPTLRQLHHLDRSSSEFRDQLSNVLYGEEYRQCVQNLQGDHLMWLVDYLDEALDCLDPTNSGFQKCLSELRDICGTRMILPTSYTLSSYFLNIGRQPVTSRGYGDVCEGILDHTRVSIKRIQMYSMNDTKYIKTLYRGAVVWKCLAHPNIVPLLGITISIVPLLGMTITPLQLISEWMPGGDLPEYIEKYPDANRLGLLSDVAKGLCYLHSCNVIHGDLKGPNILVDNSGTARIADFGLAMVTQNVDSMQTTSCQRVHTVQWTAPEVLSGGAYSKEADIFSFAMVMTEVFTGSAPFGPGSSVVAMLTITQGGRPPRPTYPTFTEGLWILMQRCWDHDPHLRPEVSEVLRALLIPEDTAWKRLISHPLVPDERTRLITTIFSDHNQVKMVEHLSGDDAQAFIDVIDEALDSLTAETRRRCLHCLYRICDRQTRIPTSLAVPLCYDPTEDPLYCSGSADVWRGQYHGQDVAAKVLKLWSRDDPEQIKRKFCREVAAWRALCHPNLLPLVGVTMTNNRLVTVSEWMVRGNIMEFMKANINADRLGLLEDVTRGLIYMHDQGIIHGNLKGASILIANDGHACLAGFNLLTIASDHSTVISLAMTGGAVRWMSPERLDPESFGLKGSNPTVESDCYALGMVIYEVLSGETPYVQCSPPDVIREILNGTLPGRPHGVGGIWFTTDLWKVLELCWKYQPGDRPSLNTVLQCLQDITRSPRPPGDHPDATENDPGPPIVHGGNGTRVSLQVGSPGIRRVVRRTRKKLKTTVMKLYAH